MRRFGAVIFDMDGVLVDSEPLHLRATQAALGARGGSYTDRDNQAFFGTTDPEMLRVLRILFDLPESTAELVEVPDRAPGRADSRRGDTPARRPGRPPALRRSGVPLALASASRKAIIAAVLETLDLARAFEAVVSGDDVVRGSRRPTASCSPPGASGWSPNSAWWSRTRGTASSPARRPG